MAGNTNKPDVKGKLGQQIMDNSVSMTIASDQTAIPVTGSFTISSAAVTVADGADQTQGAKADARSAATDTTAVTIMQVLKEISYMEQNPASRAVTGTFYPATQPVSIASAQVVSGAYADGAITTIGTSTDAKSDKTDGTATSVVSLLKEISYMAQNPASRAVTNAGTFATQVDGAALTALQLIDDMVPATVGDQAAGKPVVFSYGSVAINLTTGANQVLVSSSAGKQIWVYGYAFTCGDANGQTVSLQDEDDTAITGIMEFPQYGGISVPVSGNFAMPLFKLATDKDLEVDITGGDVDGWLSYGIITV